MKSKRPLHTLFYLAITLLFAVGNANCQNTANVTDNATITDRNIKFVDYPGFPEQHSTWNSIGYSPTHDKVFIGVSDHVETTALYEYDVASRQMINRGFIADLANLRDFQWQGKVHSKFVEGPEGEVYFSTDGGVLRSVHFRDHPNGYRGGFFMKWDPATEKLTNLGMGMEYDAIKDMDVDPGTGLMYGISFPQVHFMVYDAETNDYRDLGRLGGGHVPRHNFTDQWGNVYYVDWRQRLVKYEKSKGELVFARESLPAFEGTPGKTIITGITAFAKDEENGIIYLITYGAKVLAFHPTEEGIGEVVDLGGVIDTEDDQPWRPYVPNMNFGDNGKLYYFIGGHGQFVIEDHTLLVEMDPATGEQKILDKYHVSVMREATGSNTKDREGNLYFAGRKRAQDAIDGGDVETSESTPFLIIFNPEKEVR